MGNVYYRLLTSASLMGFFRLLGMGLSMLISVLVARSFGPAGLGVFGYFVVTLTILAVPVSQGWATLLLRHVAGATHDGDWGNSKGILLAGGTTAVLFSTLVFCIGYVASDWIATQVPAIPALTLVSMLAAILLLDQLSALRLATLRGLDHPLLGQLPDIVIRPAFTIVFLLFFWFLLGDAFELQHALWSLLLGSLAGVSTGALILWTKKPARFSGCKHALRLKSWARDATTLTCYSGLIILNAYTDIFILGILGTLEDVGIYRVAAQISLFSGLVFTAVNMLAAQRFAYLLKSNDRRSLESNAVFMAVVSFAGTIPIPVFFFLFGEPVVSHVFGPQFILSLSPLSVLFAVPMVVAAFGMAPTMLVMSGNETIMTRTTAMAVALNAFLCVLSIPTLGTMGAALSTLAGSTFWAISAWRQAREVVGVDTSIFGMLRRKTLPSDPDVVADGSKVPDL